MDGAYIVTESFHLEIRPRRGQAVKVSLQRDEVQTLIAVLQELLRRADAGPPVSFED